MDTKLGSFPFPFLSVQASKMIPHLLGDDAVVIDNQRFDAGFHSSTATFPDLNFTGYIWPYQKRGNSVGDPPDLWFAVSRFRAPDQWIERFLRLRNDYQIRLTQGDDTRWKLREQRLSKHVVALTPQHPDETFNDLLQAQRWDIARQFLLLGRLDPEEATVMMSDLPIPHPFCWQEANFS